MARGWWGERLVRRGGGGSGGVWSSWGDGSVRREAGWGRRCGDAAGAGVARLRLCSAETSSVQWGAVAVVVTHMV